MSFIIRRFGEQGNHGVNNNKGRFGISNFALEAAFDLAMDYGWDIEENTSSDENYPNMNYKIKSVDKFVNALKVGLTIHKNKDYHQWLTNLVSWLETFEDEEVLAFQ